MVSVRRVYRPPARWHIPTESLDVRSGAGGRCPGPTATVPRPERPADSEQGTRSRETSVADVHPVRRAAGSGLRRCETCVDQPRSVMGDLSGRSDARCRGARGGASTLAWLLDGGEQSALVNGRDVIPLRRSPSCNRRFPGRADRRAEQRRTACARPAATLERTWSDTLEPTSRRCPPAHTSTTSVHRRVVASTQTLIRHLVDGHGTSGWAGSDPGGVEQPLPPDRSQTERRSHRDPTATTSSGSVATVRAPSYAEVLEVRAWPRWRSGARLSLAWTDAPSDELATAAAEPKASRRPRRPPCRACTRSSRRSGAPPHAIRDLDAIQAASDA